MQNISSPLTLWKSGGGGESGAHVWSLWNSETLGGLRPVNFLLGQKHFCLLTQMGQLKSRQYVSFPPNFERLRLFNFDALSYTLLLHNYCVLNEHIKLCRNDIYYFKIAVEVKAIMQASKTPSPTPVSKLSSCWPGWFSNFLSLNDTYQLSEKRLNFTRGTNMVATCFSNQKTSCIILWWCIR